MQLSDLVSSPWRLLSNYVLTKDIQVNENLDAPINIASVRVRGAVRTRESFLGSIIDPILQSPDENGATLGGVLRRTKEIKTLLEDSDLFTNVEAVLDRSRDPMAHPDDVDVVFLTRERGRYFLNTSTQVGNNEGGAVSVCYGYHTCQPSISCEIVLPPCCIACSNDG